jgi:hypothetical protein
MSLLTELGENKIPFNFFPNLIEIFAIAFLSLVTKKRLENSKKKFN